MTHRPTIFPFSVEQNQANAWICAPQATNRDLESVSATKKVNAWVCALSATDRDLETKR